MPANSDDFTLDPPGTIAVVGAGLLGIEAALYGRFLGYNVSVLEADSVAASWQSIADQPLPFLPDQSLSSLAKSALAAQRESSDPIAMPISVGQWIDQFLLPLTESDLLIDRVRTGARVIGMESLQIEAEEDDEQEPDGELPPDFRLILEAGDPCDAEAVILAIGSEPPPTNFPREAAYLFRIGAAPSDSVQQSIEKGYRQITEIFAGLAGRADLDLYRPPRL